MRSSTAAALVGAAIVSTVVFPFAARMLRAGAIEAEAFPPSVLESPASAA
jgi:hypothetical protein